MKAYKIEIIGNTMGVLERYLVIAKGLEEACKKAVKEAKSVFNSETGLRVGLVQELPEDVLT